MSMMPTEKQEAVARAVAEERAAYARLLEAAKKDIAGRDAAIAALHGSVADLTRESSRLMMAAAARIDALTRELDEARAGAALAYSRLSPIHLALGERDGDLADDLADAMDPIWALMSQEQRDAMTPGSQ